MNKKSNSSKKIVVTIVMLLLLIGITVGVTYAFFTYVGTGTTENTITTGTLTFVYDEKNASGNGIRLTNLLPQSDTAGKALVGNNQVFDFQVVATTQGSAISYEVITEKGSSSTLNEGMVKMYLTTVEGQIETPVSTTVKDNKVTTYNQLVNTKAKGQTGKTLFEEMIASNKTNYTKVFRLRMWLSEAASGGANGEWDYNNKTFSAKVNVVANGEVQTTPTPTPVPPYRDTTGASIPEPLEGMIPVTYNGSNWVKADTTAKWYDYETQMWANAVTVTEANRNTLKNSVAGTVIPMTDINTMWVWIPKYEYKVEAPFGKGGTSAALPGEIEVNFKNKTDITPTTGYTLHPAFNFGGENLSGIWIGKFETTGTIDSPTIKSNETSLRNQNVSSFFTASRAMQNVGNPYGFSNTKGDTHMMKNMEWGAVAYLSQSKYGKYGNPNYIGVNKEIYINNNSNYVTGCSAGAPSTGEVNGCTNTYNVENSGTGASTTGTIYGVYDMSGGADEYTMGVLADPSDKPRSGDNAANNSGFKGMDKDGNMLTGLDFPTNKYYDLYTGTTGLKGDATNADGIQNWYRDYAGFVNIGNPWFIRGGRFDNNNIAGIFYTYYYNGQMLGSISARMVAKS